MPISSLERIQACLSGASALDRNPVALWRHFPMDDQIPGLLANATLDFQDHYHFDLVKITPASSFCLKDWGVQDIWEGHTEGTRRYVHRVIEKPKDWENLPLLDPLRATHLAGQLDCLRMVHSRLDPGTPLLQTIFNPLAQAKNLAGGETLLLHLRTCPEAVIKGLETIAETTRRFIIAAAQTGIDGIFYAIQHAQADVLSMEEYLSIGYPADQKTLEPAGSLWCNLLHLHGSKVHFSLVDQLSPIFQIINWHDREAIPDLAEAQKHFRGVVCGGVGQNTITLGDRERVKAEAIDAIQKTHGQKFILGTGCVVPVIAPHGNIRAVIEASEMSLREY